MPDRRLVPLNRVLDVDVSSHFASLPPTTANMPTYAYSGWHSNPVALQNTHPVSWGTSLWPDAHHSSSYTTMPSHPWQVYVTPPSSGIFLHIEPLLLPAEYHFPSETQPARSRHSSPLPLSCRWIHDDTHRICGFQGALDALKAHFKTHFNAGPPDEQIVCRWDRCSYKRRSNSSVRSMRRDCMWRHICEVHLGMKRAT